MPSAMLEFLIYVLIAIDPGDGGVALARTAPQDLTVERASAHLWAARVAAVATGTDADVLLSIAWHESRYTDAVTPERGDRASCGAMTPTPVARCAPRSLLDQYLDGARHLRAWIDAAPHAYFLGYAGGYHLIRLCTEDPQARACAFPSVIRARAKLIHSAL